MIGHVWDLDHNFLHFVASNFVCASLWTKVLHLRCGEGFIIDHVFNAALKEP